MSILLGDQVVILGDVIEKDPESDLITVSLKDGTHICIAEEAISGLYWRREDK